MSPSSLKQTALGLFLSLGSILGAQSLALSFDDGPKLAVTPLLTPQQRNQAILKALKSAHIQAALFVTANNGAVKPEGLALARAWGKAGHWVGNHTLSHPDLNNQEVTLQAYEDEILGCDAIIQKLPGYQKWFRFTFLREGNTPEKRDGIKTFLIAQGYRNASVTLDTSDWRLDQRLVAALKRNPHADLHPFRRIYLEHLEQRANSYRNLSQLLFKRDIAQVALMHHNLINALFLKDAILMFKAKGWTFVSPAEAFADPVYLEQPERLFPGQSLLLSIARSRNIKLADVDRLVDDADAEIEEMDRLGL